ncbi:hypothetical protein Q7P36_008891 [Cladosporium allicinum]
MESSSKIFWISLRMIQLAIMILILGLSAYVNKYFHEFESTPSGSRPLNFLLLSSLITPFALTYILAIPARYPSSKWNSTKLFASVEGSMALLWAASSMTSAVEVTDRMCFGSVCGMAQAVVVLGVFEWMAFLTSFGFSLAGIYRNVKCEYAVVESGESESGRIESGKGKNFE